jgi:amidase
VVHLVAAGHTVVWRDSPIGTGATMGALTRWMAGAEDDAEHLGLDRKALQPRSRTHARMGRLVRLAGLVRPRTQERFRNRMASFFGDVDLLLSPVTTGPPLAARPWHERSFTANVMANARWAPWTAAWNLAGLPALVLPAGNRPDGLPLAVQFVGPAGTEARLLWIAGELERRQPWRRYAPVFDPTATSVPALV